LAGCTEDGRAGLAAEKGSLLARPFPQTSLLCSPLARPVVQLVSPQKVQFFHLATQPTALHLVLSQSSQKN